LYNQILEINEMNRLFLHLHLALSLFFAPLICVCAVTGVLNLCHVSDQWTSSVAVYEFPSDSSPQYTATCDDLKSRGIELPSGPVKPFKGMAIKGTPTSSHILFKPNGDRLRVEIVEPGVYPKLLLMHKGKTGLFSNILLVGAACALLIAYLSGLAILWNNRKRRLAMGLWFGSGLLFFLVAYFTL
jgi:hypothetical protein